MPSLLAEAFDTFEQPLQAIGINLTNPTTQDPVEAPVAILEFGGIDRQGSLTAMITVYVDEHIYSSTNEVAADMALKLHDAIRATPNVPWVFGGISGVLADNEKRPVIRATMMSPQRI